MYATGPLFSYAENLYHVMPKGLPNRFYPKDPCQKHETDDYVICFSEGIPQHIKQRLIHDYAEHHRKEKQAGVYR